MELESNGNVTSMNAEGLQIQDSVNRETTDEDQIQIGQWFWVHQETEKDKDERGWLGCVVRLGSNYAKLEGPASSYGGRYSERVHFSEFDQACTFEPNAQAIIQEKIEHHKDKARQLMGRVHEITRSLAISPRQSLSDGGGETQALAIRGAEQPIGEYKEALIKAKDETLPKLFEKIRKHNKAMGNWMQAPLLAMEAEVKILEPAIAAIKERVFNVELYAGLIEEVKLIKDGVPATISEPIHLFQRRAYMDEECLAEYETGGMEFKDIKQFDKWLIKPDNLKRLLPFPRCVLAFQVRRYEKERAITNLRQFINITFGGIKDYDKLTFLYLRNGDQVFRLNTGIEFGSQLFPDLDRSELGGKVIYARMFANRVQNLTSEGAYLDLVKRGREAKEEYERKKAKTKKKDWWTLGYPHSDLNDYVQWTPDSVLYDDISQHVKEQIDKHNRLVLVLQGLLDRSPVFHPHPPWQIWNQDSFNQAVKLIYDDSRALTDGDKPDFEAYRNRLNASLKVGSITVGQQDAWEMLEAKKENARRDRDYRRHNDYPVTRFQPDGNPGPGLLARVTAINKNGRCVYRWTREKLRFGRYEDRELYHRIPCSLALPSPLLLNISAYQKDDFKVFFSDPRSRADYLQWAIFLLTAEEYLAGNKKVSK